MNTIEPKNLLSVILLLFLPVLVPAQLFINEWMADNETSITDEAGMYEDWIEIYNAGDEAIDLQGYYLTDDQTEPDQFLITESLIIPADGFLLFWADNDPEEGAQHLNFKLSANGEEILLNDSNLTLVHAVEFSAQTPDVSMGSYPDGSNNFFTFSSFTPETSNGNDGDPAGLSAPTFGLQGGVFASSQQISLFAPSIEVEVYYTLDGSNPDQGAIKYTGPFTVENTSIVRAVSIRTGYPNSSIVSQSYFINIDYSLPILSLVANPDDFFGADGIYTNPFEGGSDWERFCQVQYFKNNALEFEVDAGIRIQGSSSVGLPKKSFRLFFESAYGQKWLEHPLFEGNEVDRFRNLVLRSGYDDDLTSSTGTLLRDPFCSLKYEESGGLVSDAEWTILTINGEFWGIYEIRESVNDHFIETHTNWNDFDQIRFTKEGPELKNGSIDDWQALTDFLENNDFSDPQKYAEASELIDMDNLINLMAFMNNSAYSSWTWGVTAYKENVSGGKWKFTVWDMDRALFNNGWDGFAEFQNTDGIYWANFMPKALIENIDFRNQLLNRTADLFNTIFAADQALADITNLKNQILAEVPNEYDRWEPDGDIPEWENEIGKVTSFLEDRKEDLQSQNVGNYDLPGANELIIDVNGAGHIELNSLSLNSFPWTGEYFSAVPISLRAVADPGYIFDGWSDASLPNSPAIELDFLQTKNLTANFVQGNTEDHAIIINEINYHSADSINAGDWIELYNVGGQAANISGWYLADENNNYFNLPANTILEAGDYLVIVEDEERFDAIYPTVSNVIGSFGEKAASDFGLSNAGELINLYNADQTFSDEVDYNDKDPWPISPDGSGHTLQLITPDLDNNLPGNWAGADATPGRENFTDLKTAQEINFSSLDDKYTLDEPFDLNASSNSGLEVEYALVDGPASLDGNIITLDGIAGTVTVIASQDGNSDYLPAETVAQSFEVLLQPQTISFDTVDDQLPTADPIALMVSASSGLGISLEYLSGPVQLDGNILTLTGELGEVVIEANQEGNATYAPAEEQFIMFEVDKNEQTLSFAEVTTKLTTAADFEIMVSSDAGLTPDVEIVSGPASLTGNTVSLDGTAGEVTIRARQLGDDVTHVATEAFEVFQVVLTPQSIDFPQIANRLTTDLPFTIEANSNAGLEVTFEIISGPATILGTEITLNGEPGVVEIKALQSGDLTYEPAAEVVQNFQVTQIPLLDQTIEFLTLDNKYTFDLPFAIEATASSALPITFEIVEGPATINGNMITLNGVPGVVKIEAKQLGNEDYNPASSVFQTFEVIEVVPEDQDIDFGNLNNQFTTALPFSISATASSMLPVSFSILEGPAILNDNEVTLTGAEGIVTIVAIQQGDNFYNPAIPVAQSFEVILKIDELPQPYCHLEIPINDVVYINEFNFGDIENTSTASGYADFTNLVTTVRHGASHDFALTPGFTTTPATSYCHIWLDLNRDGVFSMSEEMVFTQSINNGVEVEGEIIIPDNARLGLTKMRVSLTTENIEDPCLDFNNGEVEDYAVFIDEASALETLTVISNGIAVYPNPTDGIVNVKSVFNTIEHLTVFDVHGRKMIEKNNDQSLRNFDQLNLASLPEGYYFIEVKLPNGLERRKIFLGNQ